MKRKKKTRQRGSKTHGWGAMKKHRGAGNRGGRGMAGTGKRGDAKKPSIGPRYFGKHGFKPRTKRLKTINVSQLHLISDQDTLSLKELGYQKLLGKGKPAKKFTITVGYASKGAIQKIEKAGGTVKAAAPKTKA